MAETNMIYREATEADVPELANLRWEVWGEKAYWEARILGYLNGNVNPQHALPTRIIYVAIKDGKIIGFIAGHLTKRFGCDGELEWINVASEYRRTGTSAELLTLLARWFVTQNALYVCVDCAPDNEAAQRFYKKHGAENLNEHWLIWKDINVLLKGEEML